MVLVSRAHRLIYIKNLKVGGTSLEAALESAIGGEPVSHSSRGRNRDGLLVTARMQHGGKGVLGLQNHDPLEKVLSACPYARDYLVVFTVREPLDWFESYCAWAGKGHPKGGAEADRFFREARERTTLRGELPRRRFVVRFESMREDVARLGELLGLEITLPHYKRSEPRDLARAYGGRAYEAVLGSSKWERETFGYQVPDWAPRRPYSRRARPPTCALVAALAFALVVALVAAAAALRSAGPQAYRR